MNKKQLLLTHKQMLALLFAIAEFIRFTAMDSKPCIKIVAHTLYDLQVAIDKKLAGGLIKDGYKLKCTPAMVEAIKHLRMQKLHTDADNAILRLLAQNT